MQNNLTNVDLSQNKPIQLGLISKLSFLQKQSKVIKRSYLRGAQSLTEKDTSDGGLKLLQTNGARYYPGVSASFPADGTITTVTFKH